MLHLISLRNLASVRFKLRSRFDNDKMCMHAEGQGLKAVKGQKLIKLLLREEISDSIESACKNR